MGWLIAIAVVALLALSWLFSADSRDNEDWKPLAGGVGVAPHHLVRPFSASPGAQAIGRAAAYLGVLVVRPWRPTGRAEEPGRQAPPPNS
ncbi:MAG: hypothetical protein ABSE77_01145 [Acidimicrobiales bacterium]|jgi:hypothetical protein